MKYYYDVLYYGTRSTYEFVMLTPEEEDLGNAMFLECLEKYPELNKHWNKEDIEMTTKKFGGDVQLYINTKFDLDMLQEVRDEEGNVVWEKDTALEIVEEEISQEVIAE